MEVPTQIQQEQVQQKYTQQSLTQQPLYKNKSILIAFSIIFSLTIAGILLLLLPTKKTTQEQKNITKLEQTNTDMQIQTNSQTVPQQNGSGPKFIPRKIKNKVLFRASGSNALMLASEDGKEVVPFSNVIDPRAIGVSDIVVSPDQTKMLLPSTDPKEIITGTPEEQLLVKLKATQYNLVTMNGELIKKIDRNTLHTFGDNTIILYAGWSSDSRELLFHAIETNPDNTSARKKLLLVSHDIANNSSKTLLDENHDTLTIYFYDPVKKLLAFRGYYGGTDTFHVLNLETKNDMKINIPSFKMLGEENFYAHTLCPDLFSHADITRGTIENSGAMYIRSFYEPTKDILRMSLSDLKKTPSGNSIVFSPDCNYFSLMAFGQHEEMDYVPKYMNFYKKDGTFLSTISTLDTVYGKTVTEGAFASNGRFVPSKATFIPTPDANFGFFSSDGNSYLMTGQKAESLPAPKMSNAPGALYDKYHGNVIKYWQIFNTTTGASISAQISPSGFTGRIVYWFK